MYANRMGASWSHAKVISDCMNGTNDWNTGSSNRPKIAIDKNTDNIHVVWDDDTNLTASEGGLDREIMYANYRAATGQWSHAKVISDCMNGTDDWNTDESAKSSIAVDSQGNVHVVWQDDTDLIPSEGGTDPEIMYTKYTLPISVQYPPAAGDDDDDDDDDEPLDVILIVIVILIVSAGAVVIVIIVLIKEGVIGGSKLSRSGGT